MMKIGQQIVSQVSEQDICDLSQITMLATDSQAQTAFDVAKLLNFRSTPSIVEGQEVSFGRQRKRSDIIAVVKLVILPTAFYKDTHRTSIILGRRHFCNPSILVSIPATHLLNQGHRAVIVHALVSDVVASLHQPAQFLFTLSASIQSPNRACALRSS